jgi:hypothetical protein
LGEWRAENSNFALDVASFFSLALLFCFRAAGQAIVYFFGVEFLPPMERWHSGLLPYPLLLAVQIALVVLMLRMVWDFSRGEGYFVGLKPHTGRVLKVLSCVYALAMVSRYAVTMVLYPQYRWFIGTLPIWFHFVLAAFLFVVGRFSSDRAADPAAKRVS